MTDRTDSGRSSAQRAGAAFAFSELPAAPFGAETVVNPERRGALPQPSSMLQPGSSLWQTLFPPDGAVDHVSPLAVGGFELGHFTVEERIGMGGMGAVFRALDRRLQRIVALKVLSPVQSRDHASVQRFQNEARAAARLDHDNIARVYYVGEDKGLHFIAFEYVTGTNLRDLIRETGPLNPAEAVNYALQIATALKHTAAAGVVHRDIKPSNIIVAPSGRAKLVDLGLARKQTTDSLGDLTIAGTTLGTFDYISPEQAKDPRNVDVRSDIYSLGCTLYHALTGEPPYPDGTVLQKLLDHQGKDPPDPALKNRRVTPELSAIVRKMMASDPRQRYATPDDLIRDLMPLAGAMGLRAFPPEGLIWASPPAQREAFWERHLGWIATVAALLLIVIFIERFPGVGQEAENPAETRQSAVASRSGGDAGKSEQSSAGISRNMPQSSERHAMNGAVARSDGADLRETKLPQPLGSPVPEAAEPLGPAPTLFNFPLLADSVTREPWPQRAVVPEPPVASAVDRAPVIAPPPEPSSASAEDVASTARQVPATDSDATSGSKELAVDETRPFLILGSDRAEPEAKPTLEAACAAAKDGNIIELRYNGRRAGGLEKPLRIANKKVTIRAGDGFRPVVEFATSEESSLADEFRMISLIDGSVDLINIDVVMRVPRDADFSDRWALVALEGDGSIRVQGSTLTIVNPSSQPAAMVELVSEPGDALPDMRMMGTGPTSGQTAYKVEVTGCVLRGTCDLLVAEHSYSGRVDLQQSIVAVGGSLLSMPGTYDLPAETAELELLLSHVTCLVGGPLIRMESGADSRNLVPVYVSTARNNIFATASTRPLVSMSGNTDPEDFRQLLRWNGERNFYDGFETFWAITSARGTMEFERRDFESWKREWARSSTTGEIDAQSGGVVWDGDLPGGMFSGVTPADLALDRSDLANTALAAATDGTDVGADHSRLPATAPDVGE